MIKSLFDGIKGHLLGQPQQAPPVRGPGAVPWPQDQGLSPTGYQLRDGSGQVFQVPPEGHSLGLGRDPDNGAVVNGDKVSRHHAFVRVRSGRLEVLDNGSTNGTTINGQLVPPKQWHPVQLGSQVALGGHPLWIEPQPEAPPAPLLPDFPVGAAEPRGPMSPWPGAGIQGAVQAAGQMVGGPAGVAVAATERAIRLVGTDGKSFTVRPEGPVQVGRSSDNDVALTDDTFLSAHHVTMQSVGGQLMIQDHSTNGTYVNGQRATPHQWVPVADGATLQVGTRTFQVGRGVPLLRGTPETIPDGRTAWIENLPDGRLGIVKVETTMTEAAFRPQDYLNQSRRFQPVGSLDELQIGDKVVPAKGNIARHMEFLGMDAQGRLCFGHRNVGTPQEYADYKEAQAREVARKAEAAAARAQRQAEGVQALQAEEFPRVGYQPGKDPQQAAASIVVQNGKLGFDGQSIYPPEVEKAVVDLKRAEFMRDPAIAGRGLVDLRLNDWIAGRKGEIALYRGLRGTDYDPASPGRFYTSDIGCALGSYATSDKGGLVLATRMPRSSIADYVRDVGLVPGRNPYADVYDIPPEDVPALPQPAVVISTANPAHRWVFDAVQRNHSIQDLDAARDDYSSLVQQVVGRNSIYQ